MNDLISFFNLSKKNKKLVIRIFFLLPYFKLKLYLIYFKRIIKRQYLTADNFTLSDENKQFVFRVSIAINKISNVLPWPSTCLEKAITGKYLLKESGIPSTLYLGATRDESSKFKAHAWLICEEYVLIGGAEKDLYTVVGKFE